MKKTTSITPMSREDIIKAVESKRKGSFLDITWLFFETSLGAKERKRITVTKTWRLRTGINYNNMKSVKERKAIEDAAAGGELERRKSSYVHNDKEHGFIVTDRLTRTKEFLQVMVANAMQISWKKDETTGKNVRSVKPVGVERSYYADGVPITDPGLLAIVKAVTPTKSKSKDEDETLETFVLSLDKIVSIQ